MTAISGGGLDETGISMYNEIPDPHKARDNSRG